MLDPNKNAYNVVLIAKTLISWNRQLPLDGVDASYLFSVMSDNLGKLTSPERTIINVTEEEGHNSITQAPADNNDWVEEDPEEEEEDEEEDLEEEKGDEEEDPEENPE
ncbi:hypothetical protein Tco_0303932 [Tanacetum coccineum]